MEAAGQLQCVGKLEIVKPKPVGFLCGTLHVPTDSTFPSFHSAIVPSPNTIGAPRYQMLPAETDLNTLPLPSNIPEKVFSAESNTSEGIKWDNSALCPNLFKKCEALAVSGLTEYGDEIDVVAPTDILKQIFKIPYSKVQLSVAVQRIGDTLILNAGPNVEEEEKLFRRQNNHAKCSDPSIFLNFAMHSVRAEACDCPPTHQTSSPKQPNFPSFPVNFGIMDDSYVSSTSTSASKSQLQDQKNSNKGKKTSQSNNDNYFWDNKMNKHESRSSDSVKRTQLGEKLRCPIQDSEKHRRLGNNGFLRVLFWQFHNFRMLLGSDILLFSNDKYVAVSLHLWDVTRKVTPLTWLDAWLDNIMASVPEVAICYHQNGVVQGYELLKTDDIFLLKGVSEDGIPAFHPQVVQQNGLSVLRFLQENCKQDPGAYWLYKGSGEDVIQLFDLSVLPKKHPDDDHVKAPSSLSSLMQKGRRDVMFSLGTLLYRIAHRLSLSKALNNRRKCANFFRKCLDFLREQDYVVVRAYAHEQFARLILKCYEDLDLTSDTFLVEPEVRVANLEERSESSFSMFGFSGQSTSLFDDDAATNDGNSISGAPIDTSAMLNIEVADSQNAQNVSMYPAPVARDFLQTSGSSQENDVLHVCQISTSRSLPKIVADPISSKLAAIHHVSQAIKALRWKRHLQNTHENLLDPGNRLKERPPTVNLSLCACGDVNCIEVCDIREWLPKTKMDQKMWNLVLLLGESYLALGDAYKEDGQLHRALKVVELACLVYGSMPQHLDNACFISSMDSGESYQLKLKKRNDTPFSLNDAQENLNFNLVKQGYLSQDLSSAYLFWPKAWSLVGDVYVEYQRTNAKEGQDKKEDSTSGNELRVSNEVVREVLRLKKKLGQYMKNCGSCLLINCSCQNDRASSGNSASSSGNAPLSYSKKHNRKLSLRDSSSHCGNVNDTSSSCRSDCFDVSESIHCESNGEDSQVPAKPYNAFSTVLGILGRENNTLDNTPEQAPFSPNITDASKVGNGGIFRFLEGPEEDNVEYNLSTALYCYNAARKAIKGFHLCSAEFTSILKKKGWVSNELGRYRLDKKNLLSAEFAFAEAIQAFKEVSDHTNVILVHCNLGHGRRSLAEKLVSKLDDLIEYDFLQNEYKQAIKTAKLEYYESIKHYGAAKMELNSVSGTCDTLLYNEVYTQFAHTYLRLGMLLAKEGISDKVHAVTNKDFCVNVSTVEQQKMATSASDAFREALSIYESLGVLRKQEVAFTHFQLGSFHRDNCLKLVDLEQQQFFAKAENKHLKTKWYSSLADKHWKMALDFYCPMTHPVMFLNILLEQATLSIELSNSFHSNAMLDAALLYLLDGRKIVESEKDCEIDRDSQLKSKFWSQLQLLLKNMLFSSLSGSCNKTGGPSLQASATRVWDKDKLREMYRMSLKSTSFNQLHEMHKLWLS